MSSKLKPQSLLLALIVIAVFLVVAPSASPNTTRGKPPGKPGKPGSTRLANHYIVVLKSSVRNPGAVAARQARKYGAKVTQVYGSALKGYAAVIPAHGLASLRTNHAVRFVTPDRTVRANGQTVPTGVERVRALGKSNKGAGVNVAVLDTGIDTSHPDLAANIAGGVNCADGGKRNYTDGNGHGTHVAGIIAAIDNDIGVVGVAPEAKLWSVRVLNDNGMGFWSWIICGIDFVDSQSPAKGGPIKVANMSLGGIGTNDGNCGQTDGDAMHFAICRAVADGVTFVVAAGNSGMDLSGSTKFVPASYGEVITATALADSDGVPCGSGAVTKYGSDDTFAYFSNYATSSTDLNHMIAAPGVSIYSTYKGGGYATLSGTSMASPHVAGAAALYLATHPGASPASVLDALKGPGEPRNTDFNNECGGSTSKGKGGGGKYSHSDPGRHPEYEVRADSL
jgi:subtilisin